MLRSLKNKIVLIIATLTIAVPAVLVPLPTYASCNGNIAQNVGSGVDQAIGNNGTSTCNQSGSLTGGISNIARKVVNIFSIVVGIVSVIMIIYAGFRYVTSGGESGSVSSAKNTLLYAIIGLVIVVLAQLIVHYVLNTASTFSGPTG